MVIQDLIITIVSFALSVPLVPQIVDTIKGAEPINRITSVTTCICLTIMGITFSSLGLWLSAIAAYITSFMWGILFSLSFKVVR
jgi:hypothetical protein